MNVNVVPSKNPYNGDGRRGGSVSPRPFLNMLVPSLRATEAHMNTVVAT